MRAVAIGEGRSLEPRELPEPDPGEGQVRVRVAACGICGSDIHMRPSDQIPAGAVMGHELAGLVDALGPGVEGWSEGDRVCVYPFQPLERHDLDAAMASGIGMGAHQGGFADAVCVDQSMLWRLPEGLELEHGTLVEPLAVALHGLNLGEVESGDPCLVIGAGPIGVMAALALRARGVERIAVLEKNERRRERMERLGFDTVGLDDVHTALPERLGELPRVVLECAGNPAAPGLAVELVAATGRVVLLGMLEEPVAISQLLLMLKEAQIRASFAYRPGDFDEAIHLLNTGSVPAAELITGREPLENAQQAFEDLEDPATEHIKLLLVP